LKDAPHLDGFEGLIGDTNMTAKTETTIDTNELSATLFVKNALGYADAQKAMADLKTKSDDCAHAMLPFLKANAKEDWKILGKAIKEALTALSVPDINGKLGAFKTCFEKQIMPTDLNADRLRKAETWISWTGKTVPNSYTAKHVDAKANQPAPNMTKTIEAVKTAIQSAGAPSAPSAPKASEKKGEIARPNVTASDTLTTSEYWDTLYGQFVKHGMTAFYIKALAGALNTTESALFKTMTTVHDDIMAQAQKIEAKK